MDYNPFQIILLFITIATALLQLFVMYMIFAVSPKEIKDYKLFLFIYTVSYSQYMTNNDE